MRENNNNQWNFITTSVIELKKCLILQFQVQLTHNNGLIIATHIQISH